MGSGIKRNASDKVIITLKKRVAKTRGSGSSDQTKEKSPDEMKCPTSFKVRLSPELKLKIGTKLVVRPVKKTVVFYFGNIEVARLNPKKGQKIALCIDKGFRYEGTVKKEGGAFYVEALRTI